MSFFSERSAVSSVVPLSIWLAPLHCPARPRWYNTYMYMYDAQPFWWCSGEDWQLCTAFQKGRTAEVCLGIAWQHLARMRTFSERLSEMWAKTRALVRSSAHGSNCGHTLLCSEALAEEIALQPMTESPRTLCTASKFYVEWLVCCANLQFVQKIHSGAA